MNETAAIAGLARVVHVVDDMEVVINRGLADGIGLGSRFLVFGKGPMIKDPDSGRELGELELVRGRAEAVHVQDRMTTLRSVEKKRVGSTVRRLIARSGIAAAAFAPENLREIEEAVPADIELPLSGVRVGDLAKPV